MERFTAFVLLFGLLLSLSSDALALPYGVHLGAIDGGEGTLAKSRLAQFQSTIEGETEGSASVGDSSPNLGEGVERVVEITSIEFVGRRQVSREQIAEALTTEGLTVGTSLFWPNDQRVKRARARLAATGYFSRVTIRLKPLEQRPNQSPDQPSDQPSDQWSNKRLDQRLVQGALEIEVEERGSLVLRDIYLGSSKLTPFRGGLSFLEKNLFGRSFHIGGGFIWGFRPREMQRARNQHGYRILFEAPGVAHYRIGVVATAHLLFASERFRHQGSEHDHSPSNFTAANYQRGGGTLGVTLPFAVNLRLGVDLRLESIFSQLPFNPERVFENGSTQPVDLRLKRGQHLLSTFELSLSWDGRKQTAELGRGGRFRVDLQMSSPALGSSYEYIKAVLGAGYSFRLPWGHWLSPKILAGQIVGRAPRFEMFAAGDLSDWVPGREMGLLYSSRAPFDVWGTGIDTFDLASIMGRVDLEYSIPLFSRARTAFIPGGYLFISTGSFLLGESRGGANQSQGVLHLAPGMNADLGLRLETGVGNFEISIGGVLERSPL